MPIQDNPSAYAATIYPTKGDRHLDVYFDNIKEAKLQQQKLREEQKKKDLLLQQGLDYTPDISKVHQNDVAKIMEMKKERDAMAIDAYKGGEDYTNRSSPSYGKIKAKEDQILSFSAISAQQRNEIDHQLGIYSGDKGEKLDQEAGLNAIGAFSKMTPEERMKKGVPPLFYKAPTYDRQAYIKAQQGQIEKPSTRMEDIKGKPGTTRAAEITEYTPEQAAIGGMKFIEGSPQERELIRQEFSGLSEPQKLEYAKKAQQINEKGTVPGEVLPEHIYAQEKYLPQYNVKDEKWQQRNDRTFVINNGNKDAVTVTPDTNPGSIKTYANRNVLGKNFKFEAEIPIDESLSVSDNKTYAFNATGKTFWQNPETGITEPYPRTMPVQFEGRSGKLVRIKVDSNGDPITEGKYLSKKKSDGNHLFWIVTPTTPGAPAVYVDYTGNEHYGKKEKLTGNFAGKESLPTKKEGTGAYDAL